MSGLKPKMVCHAFNISSGSKPIRVARKNFHPEAESQIKEEIEKLTKENIKIAQFHSINQGHLFIIDKIGVV